MRIENLITGSTPGVLHRNGNPPAWRERWERIVAGFFDETLEPCGPCDELTILTWSNRSTKGVLERCLDRWGVAYVTLGTRLPEWRNDMKLYLNATTLRQVSSPYVLALDSDDVLVVSSPRRILSDFTSLDCDMLFGTERDSYPDVPALTEFERSIAKKPFCHLNSGAWIGKTETCRRFFRDCLGEHRRDIVAAQPVPHTFRDDQGLTRKTFRRHYPAARLDDRCRIFQSLYNVPLDGEIAITAARDTVGIG